MQPDYSKIPLHDIHLPKPVSWWPPAPGWWLLLLLIAVSVLLVVWLVKRHRRNKLRRISIKALNTLYKNYQNNFDAKLFARELSVLLRRICLSYFPQGEAAGLAGMQWLEYLDGFMTAKLNKSGHKFSDGVGVILCSAPYRHSINDSAINVDALYRLSLEWINSLGAMKSHRTKQNKPAIDTPSLPHNRKVRATQEQEAAHVSV